ncbi:MAG: hypothetical protein U5Q03_04580 [Bacteroidota bacterium]|nr:hypothetical protein [Bacteroidota bacterium]
MKTNLITQQFENSIQQAAKICELSMLENKINPNDNFAKNLTIFNYMSDTVQVKLSGQEKILTHYPIKYDFEDYMGNDNWSNMFVSKLMATNSGQCHYYAIVLFNSCTRNRSKIIFDLFSK